MKKILLSLVFLLGLTTVINAQEAGKIWVGGSVGFGTSKTKGDDNSTTSFVIMPEVGYILSDKLGAAINVGYGQTKYGDDKTSTFSVSPFVRYALLKGNIGGLFVDGGIGYSQEKTGDIKTKTFDVGFIPGVAVNVNDHIALTAKFGFLGYENEKTGSVKENSFGFDFSLDRALLGVSILF